MEGFKPLSFIITNSQSLENYRNHIDKKKEIRKRTERNIQNSLEEIKLTFPQSDIYGQFYHLASPQNFIFYLHTSNNQDKTNLNLKTLLGLLIPNAQTSHLPPSAKERAIIEWIERYSVEYDQTKKDSYLKRNFNATQFIDFFSIFKSDF